MAFVAPLIGFVTDAVASIGSAVGIGAAGAAAADAIPAAIDVTPEIAGLGGAAAAAGAGDTVLTAAGALGLTGSVVSGIGQLAAASAQQKALQFNTATTNQQANQTLAAGAANAQEVEVQNEQRYGQAAATLAASGVDPTQGSPLDVMRFMTGQGELQRRLTVWNSQQQAQQLRNRAALSQYQSGVTGTAGAISAGSTLLTGLGRTFGSQPGSPLSVPLVTF